LKKITDFLESDKLLTPQQFGFRKKTGTNDALKSINDVVTGALNEGKYVGAVLIDLQKAFDTIDHNILLDKCSNLGIRGKMLNIIKSYMTNRKTSTKINNNISEMKNIEFGVPQGSVLGPLLFIIYINDITKYMDNVHTSLYADDILLISVHQNYDVMINNLQSDFNAINDWLILNELFINENKTQFITISSPHMKKPDEVKMKILIHDSKCTTDKCTDSCIQLDSVKETKYLGYVIDDHWSHNAHIKAMITRLRKLMPSLYKLKHVLNKKNKLTIYYAWVESILRYGIEIFGYASKYYITRLQKLQNKIIKTLFKINANISTEDLFKDLKILQVTQLRNLVVSLNNYFDNTFKAFSNSKRLYFRNSTYKFTVPQVRNEYGKRNRNYTVPMLFNNLPENVLIYNNKREGKINLKLFFMK
jgi:hypothetical protein